MLLIQLANYAKAAAAAMNRSIDDIIITAMNADEHWRCGWNSGSITINI